MPGGLPGGMLKLRFDWYIKPALTFRRWKSNTGKRLTITANFQEWNLGTALNGKKNPAPYRKKLDRSRARD